MMRRMLAVRSSYRRSDWYIGMRFDPTRDNIESVRDDDRHTSLRSRMAAGVSSKHSCQIFYLTSCSIPVRRTRTLKEPLIGIFRP